MKRLLLLLALMGMVAVSCSKEQPNENEGGNENDIPENIFFALDKESITISPDGGSVDVVVYSNYKWEISGTSDWCTPSITNGEANEDGQKVTFSADMTYDDREATFWFRCADEKTKLVVSQKLKAVIIPDENNSFNIPAEGGIAVISYQTSVDCEIIIPQEAQDWITIAPATRGLVTYNTTLNITANDSGKQRSSVVKVISQDHNELFAEYTITQDTRCILYYTSNNGKIVEPNNSSSFDAGILSNTYNDGVGVIVFNAPITTIGQSAFMDCTTLTSVTIPDSVTEIGSEAFYKCSSLTSVTIPDSVTEIGEYAFYFCRSLTSVTIPDSVTLIGEYAFYYCSSLTSVTIPDSVTLIGEYAFYYCSSLTSVTIPNSVTLIGDHTFSGCISLTSVTIPDSVTLIGEGAFTGCDSLTSVTIPDSVTEIGSGAFKNCSSLTSVTIPDSVTEIGSWVFSCCWNLRSVTIPDSVTLIGEGAFYECGSLTSVTIPDSVTEIGNEAFFYCNSLTSITIGDSVTEIGSWVFSYCWNLTSVTIPDSVTEIGEYAFYECSSLTSVTIGDGVTEIGSSAFRDCSSLTSVYCKAATPPMGGSYMFYNTASGCKIYVPRNSVEAYEDSYYWGDYYIVGYDF